MGLGVSMSDLREAAAMALYALELECTSPPISETEVAMAMLKDALAQPEQDLQLVANFLKEYGLEVLEVIAALKTQPEPEPFGWLYESRGGVRVFHPVSDNKRFQTDWGAAQQYPEAHKMTPLYAAPPQRKPLTDGEVYALVDATLEHGRCALARAIEKAHGIE